MMWFFSPRHSNTWNSLLRDKILMRIDTFSSSWMCCMHTRCHKFAFLHARCSKLMQTRTRLNGSCCLTRHVCLSLFPPSGNGSVVEPCISPIKPGSISLNRRRVLSQQALVRSRVRPQWRREKETLTILRLEATLFLLVVWQMREWLRLNKSPQLGLATFLTTKGCLCHQLTHQVCTHGKPAHLIL